MGVKVDAHDAEPDLRPGASIQASPRTESKATRQQRAIAPGSGIVELALTTRSVSSRMEVSSSHTESGGKPPFDSPRLIEPREPWKPDAKGRSSLELIVEPGAVREQILVIR